MRGGLVVGLLAAFTLGGGSAQAFAATLIVDAPNPELECPAADFSSINAAVAAATPGDTIKVCPGLYPESVPVPKTLTLLGQGPDPRRRTGDATRESVVQYAFIGFDLFAQGVTISGFTIQGTTPGMGIRTSSAFSGYTIRHNYLHRNNTDLILQSNGADPTTVRGNALNNDSDSPATASRTGISNLFGLTGTLVDATIENNYLTKHHPDPFPSGNGMQFFGVSQLRILRNDSMDDQEILISTSSGVTVAHNDIIRSGASGVRVFSSTDVSIVHNRAEGCRGPGFLVGDAEKNEAVVAFNHSIGNTDGIVIVRSRGVLAAHNASHRNSISGIRASFGGGNLLLGNNTDENVRRGIFLLLEDGSRAYGNRARNNGVDGLGLSATTNSVVALNHIEGNAGSGISTLDSDGNRLYRNHARRNGQDGIRMDGNSMGNEIVRNQLTGNAEHDCHDDSVGPGTAGTGNLWTGNHGRTENRPGLCVRFDDD